MDNIIHFQLIAASVIFVITVLCGLLPLRWKNSDNGGTRDTILSLFLLFTGGVFLGVGLLHMLPESVEMYGRIQDMESSAGGGGDGGGGGEDGEDAHGNLGKHMFHVPGHASEEEGSHEHGFPLVFFLAAVGFLTVALIEKQQFYSVPEDRARIMAVTTSARTTDGGAELCYVEIDPKLVLKSGALQKLPEDAQMITLSHHDTCDHEHHQHLHRQLQPQEDADGGPESGNPPPPMDHPLSLSSRKLTDRDLALPPPLEAEEEEKDIAGTQPLLSSPPSFSSSALKIQIPNSPSILLSSPSPSQVAAAYGAFGVSPRTAAGGDGCGGGGSGGSMNSNTAKSLPRISIRSRRPQLSRHHLPTPRSMKRQKQKQQRQQQRLESPKLTPDTGEGGGGPMVIQDTHQDPVKPPLLQKLEKQLMQQEEGHGKEEAEEHRMTASHPHHTVHVHDEAEIPGETRVHHHHHITLDADQSSLIPFMLAIVFSIHSFVEGLALGVQGSVDSNAVSILIAILSHKLLEALAVGSNFAKEGVDLRSSIPVILVYCIMTPLGILLGAILTSLFTGLVALKFQCYAQAFAGGTFLYLAVHEMEDFESSKGVGGCCKWWTSGWVQIGLMALGVGAMSILTLWV